MDNFGGLGGNGAGVASDVCDTGFFVPVRRGGKSFWCTICSEVDAHSECFILHVDIEAISYVGLEMIKRIERLCDGPLAHLAFCGFGLYEFKAR